MSIFHLKNLNFQNIRLSKEFEINENPNDNFFYVLTDIVDFEVNNNIHEWSKVLLKIDCMHYIKNNDNCFLIFFHYHPPRQSFECVCIQKFPSICFLVGAYNLVLQAPQTCDHSSAKKSY